MEVNKQLRIDDYCPFEGGFVTQDNKKCWPHDYEKNANFNGTVTYQDKQYQGTFSGEFYTIICRVYYLCVFNGTFTGTINAIDQ